MLPVRFEFTIRDRSRDGCSLGLVEHAIVICVISRDISVHFRDVGEQHVNGWRFPLRSSVSWELERAIGEGFPERFFFRLVKLTILVSVEGRDLREDFCQVFHNRSRISVVLSETVMHNAAAMNLRDCDSANHET